MQEHLGKIVHGLPLTGNKVSKLVDYKVRHTLQLQAHNTTADYKKKPQNTQDIISP